MNKTMTSRFLPLLLSFSKKCLVLYLSVGLLCFLLVDSDKANLNRLNFLKGQVASYMLELEHSPEKPDIEKIQLALYYNKKVHKRFPDSLVHGRIGTCYFYLNEQDQAIKAYQEAIALEPQLYSFYWDLGVVFFEIKDYERSVEYLGKAFRQIPIAMMYFKQTDDLLNEKGLTRKIVFIKQLEKRAKVDAETALHLIAQSYFHLNKYREMQRVASEGIKSFPNSALLKYDLGLAFYRQEDYPKAAVFLSQAIGLAPHFLEAYQFRAACWEKMNMYGKRHVDLKAATDLKDRGKTGTVLPRVHSYYWITNLRLFLKMTRV